MKTRNVSILYLMGVVFLAITLLPNTAWAAWETVIPVDSLMPANFDTYWNYNYGWGDTHDGAGEAKMYPEQVSIDASGVVTIVAETPDPESTYPYRSGAFHSKMKSLRCDDCITEYDVKGEFKAPTIRGTWPAFWLTGSWNWPPEIDILEFKGSTTNHMNTYDGQWETVKPVIPDAWDVWHEYRCHVTKMNATDVAVDFYLDGVLLDTQIGSNFVWEPMVVIVNLQMLDDSGTPGPTVPTYYYARNIVVQHYRTDVPGAPAAPTNLAAAPDNGTVFLTWDDNPECDLSHYTVSRSTTPGGPYSQVATDVIEAAYTDTSVTNDVTYYYVVTAVDLDLNESASSNEISATPTAMYAIPIDNHSFESPPGGKQVGVMPDYWTMVGSDYGIEGLGYDGTQCAFLIGNNAACYQLTGHMITEGDQFQLNYYATRTWSNTGETATFTGNLYYDNGGSRVTLVSAPGSSSTNGSWVRYSTTVEITPGHPAIGKTLGVELVHTSSTNTWAGFDYVTVNGISPGVCGDGTCDPGEDPCNCSQDCGTPPSTETSCSDGIDDDCDGYVDCDDIDCAGDAACQCGNGICDPGEDYCSCPTDCGAPPAEICDNGLDDDCDGDIDCDDADCFGDPACPSCGDGTCNPGEDCHTCPSDCIGQTGGRPSSRYCCGDGVCEGAEDAINCEVDCGAGPVCGDGTCDPGEDECNCSQDCGTPPAEICGNGIDDDCDGYSDCDDVDCFGDPSCPTCGDGTCDPGEDQCNCSQDCGTPPAEICDNGVDDDCDGFTDCDDSDCFGDPACPSCVDKGGACTDNAECCSGNCLPAGKCK